MPNYSHTTFRFAYNESPIPMLLCKTAKGKEFLALLDTGSEITIIDKSLTNEAYLIDPGKDNITLHSLHGEDNSCESLYLLKALIINTNGNECSLSIKGISSDLSSISEFMKTTYSWKKEILAVIGSDTLNRESTKIDFEKGELTI